MLFVKNKSTTKKKGFGFSVISVLLSLGIGSYLLSLGEENLLKEKIANLQNQEQFHKLYEEYGREVCENWEEFGKTNLKVRDIWDRCFPCLPEILKSEIPDYFNTVGVGELLWKDFVANYLGLLNYELFNLIPEEVKQNKSKLNLFRNLRVLFLAFEIAKINCSCLEDTIAFSFPRQLSEEDSYVSILKELRNSHLVKQVIYSKNFTTFVFIDGSRIYIDIENNIVDRVPFPNSKNRKSGFRRNFETNKWCRTKVSEDSENFQPHPEETISPF